MNNSQASGFLSQTFQRSRGAQALWAARSQHRRLGFLHSLQQLLVDRSNDIAELIHTEVGIPIAEALAQEVLPAIQFCGYLLKFVPKNLRRSALQAPPLSSWTGWSDPEPLGVTLVVLDSFSPFFQPYFQLVQLLVAGNSVILKPNNRFPLVSRALEALFLDSGFVPDLIQTVPNDSFTLPELFEQRPAMSYYTGTPEEGKKFAEAAANFRLDCLHFAPSEDLPIVLADADQEMASSAVLWGSLAYGGKRAERVARVFVHESIVSSFCNLLSDKLSKIPFNQDYFRLFTQEDLELKNSLIQEALSSGAAQIFGDAKKVDPSPALLLFPNVHENVRLCSGRFSLPIITVFPFRNVPEVVSRVNSLSFRFTGCVFSKNQPLALELSRQLNSSSSLVNSVSSAQSSKNSEALNLLSCVRWKVTQTPRTFFYQIKPLIWYPYSALQRAWITAFIAIYSKTWSTRLKNLANALHAALLLIKREPRL